jgi:hypothetical protein
MVFDPKSAGRSPSAREMGFSGEKKGGHSGRRTADLSFLPDFTETLFRNLGRGEPSSAGERGEGD